MEEKLVNSLIVVEAREDILNINIRASINTGNIDDLDPTHTIDTKNIHIPITNIINIITIIINIHHLTKKNPIITPNSVHLIVIPPPLKKNNKINLTIYLHLSYTIDDNSFQLKNSNLLPHYLHKKDSLMMNSLGKYLKMITKNKLKMMTPTNIPLTYRRNNLIPPYPIVMMKFNRRKKHSMI